MPLGASVDAIPQNKIFTHVVTMTDAPKRPREAESSAAVKQQRTESPNLDPQQQAVYNDVMNGQSVFVTGPGGVGKSFLVKHLTNTLEQSHDIVVTSTTGVSALLINGVTIDSFLGINPYTDLQAPELHMAKLKHQQTTQATADALESCQVLVLDEVSMLSEAKFHFVVRLLQLAKDDVTHPFGGVQMIVLGDFYQLKPVSRKEDPPSHRAFAFACPAFRFLKPHVLSTQHRQTGHTVFASLLNAVRVGLPLTDEHRVCLNSCINRTFPDDGIVPVYLYAYNARVDKHNQEELDKLTTPSKTFVAKLTVSARAETTQKLNAIKKKAVAYMLSTVRTPEKLTLKVNAQVMLTYNLNLSAGLCNGAKGIVVRFDSDSGDPVVRFTTGRTVCITPLLLEFSRNRTKKEWDGTLRCLPLVLAWATSMHKSQGATIPRLVASLGRYDVFDEHMAYTVLSRGQSEESICLRKVNPATFRVNPQAQAFMRQLEKPI